MIGKPNFEEFRYEGSEDQDAIISTLANRQFMYSLTGDVSDTCEQKVATFLTTPSKLSSNNVVVRLTEFSDDNQLPSGAVFDALIAESTGCRVIDANLPGVDSYSKKDEHITQELTPYQIEDLRKGSFLKIGNAVMIAILNASTEFNIEPNYILLGSSMGSSLIAGAINAAEKNTNAYIKGLTIAEPVNVLDRSIPKLAKQFITQPTIAGYSNMNPPVLRNASNSIQKEVFRTLSNMHTNSIYAGAIARDTFLTDLGGMDYLENVPVYMTRGGASVLSPENRFKSIIDKFSKVTKVEAITFGDTEINPHDHPYCLTVQSYIDAVDNILSRE
jgi:hypothetical protein